MDIWKQQEIDIYIEELTEFFEECPGKHYFRTQGLPSRLRKHELAHLNKKLDLAKLTGLPKESLIANLLDDPNKDQFTFYLISTEEIELAVDNFQSPQPSLFQKLGDRFINSKSRINQYLFLHLLNRGYTITTPDEEYTKLAYKKIKANGGEFKEPEDFENWSFWRFMAKLRTPQKIEIAFSKERELFVLLSLKLGRPVYHRFPNLLGVLANAIQYYREAGDLILKAIQVYGRDHEISRLDRKKGTFRRKRQEYLENKPIQSKEFEEVAHMIFPELKSAS